MEDRNHGTFGERGKDRRQPATTAATTSLKPTAAKPMDKRTGRHAAIQNTLPTLATYRSWSAKARTDWEKKE